MGLSVIDARPDRQRLIDMMMQPGGYAKVATITGLSAQSVGIYARKYVKPSLKKMGITVKERQNMAQQAVESLGIDGTREAVLREKWLERVRRHEPLMDRAIEKAAESDNFAGVSSVSAARLKALELEAKATGILDDRPVTNASFVMMQGGDSHQVIEAEFRYSSESDEELSTDTTE